MKNYTDYVSISDTGGWTLKNTTSPHVCCEELSDWIITFLSDKKDKQIYDFGCGEGQYCTNLAKAGYTNVLGFEYEPSSTAVYANIVQQDLSKPMIFAKSGNVISLEVGEHIPEEHTDTFISNIYNACELHGFAIISWARVYQAGDGHINCLENDEVIELFEKKGFEFLQECTENARNVVPRKSKCRYLKYNMMVFQKVI